MRVREMQNLVKKLHETDPRKNPYCIDLDVWTYASGDVDVTYSLWDGYANHKANTQDELKMIIDKILTNNIIRKITGD